jgi:hypothetical protein
MLDLNKLAKELDEALARQTTESWNTFLDSEDLQSEEDCDYEKFLGLGELVGGERCSMNSKVGKTIGIDKAIATPQGEYNYQLAA